MKRMIILTSIILLVGLWIVCVNLFPSLVGFILFSIQEYKIMNENGERIEAAVFTKSRTLNNMPTNELIVYFPSNVIYKYLTIVPDLKMIGIADKSDKNIWVLYNKKMAYLFPSGSRFTVLNTSVKEIITQFGFSNERIQFTTFKEFEKFGKQIIINRISTDTDREASHQ